MEQFKSKKVPHNFLLFLQGFIILNLVWYVASLIIRTTVIPDPLDVYKNFGDICSDNLTAHILISLRRIAAGLILALAAGIPAGILMAYSKTAGHVLSPLVYFGYPIPKTALLPIAMLLLGIRDGSKVAIIFLIIVFQVIVSVRDSVRKIDPGVYQVMISTGAGNAQIIRHVTIPAILPDLLTSVRIALGTAAAVLFFVEGYGTKFGMGYYILDAWARIDYIDMYTGIIVISVVGFALFSAVDIISACLCRWKTE